MYRSLLLFGLILLGCRVVAQDSLRVVRPCKQPTVAWQLTAAPVPLMLGGIATYYASEPFRDMRNQLAPDFHNSYDDYLQYAPAVLTYGLKAFGVKGHTNWPRMLVANAVSVVSLAALVNGIKYSVGRMRPDDSTRNSFPSGHTATAFMTATILHKEYGLTRSPWYSVAAYGMATATAVGRQLNNRHWLSDVLMGAGIGVFSTEFGYWIASLIFKEKGIVRPLRCYDADLYNDHPSFLSIGMGGLVLQRSEEFSKDLEVRTFGGVNAGVEGAYFFTPNIGLGGSFGTLSANRALDGDRYFRHNLVLPHQVKNLVVDPISFVVSTIDAHFSLPLSSRFLADGKVKLGAGYTSQSDISIYYTPESGNTDRLLSHISPSVGFALGAGLKCTYVANGHLGVSLYADYTHYAARSEHSVWDYPANEYIKSAYTPFYNLLSIGIAVNALLW